MEVSATTWNTLSKLLDEALDLEPAARDTWLEQLSAAQPQLAPSVRKLLAAHASSETADVLAQLPELPMRSDTTRIDALSPGDRVGPYRLKRELGSGGMADVWLAERADGAFTREVALKLPLINRLRRDLAQRFARERDILARLEHPHIARLYDAGVTNDGLPYLAMEYVDGQAITEYCDSRRLDIEARLKLFLQVLDAVQFAHANLIIHRDLKPSNILVTADGQVRLLDFGIAKLLADDDTAQETQLTQLSGRALTPDYASPEQIKGEPLTIATDIYSLGVVLYELLAGVRPYRLKVNSPAQLEQAILEAEPRGASGVIDETSSQTRGTNARRLKHSLAGDLDTILLKVLAKSPQDRYPAISDFAQDLRNYETGYPITARPASRLYRVTKFIKRNKVASSVAVGVTLILAIATTFSTYQARRAHFEAILAERQTQRAEAVRDFLAGLFKASGRHQRSSQEVRKMTAVQLLEQGAAKVDELQTSAPDARVYLLRLLGEMYEELELLDRSVKLHEKSVAAAREVHGLEARETARAELELAWVLQRTQRIEEGWPLVQHAKTVLSRIAPRSGDLVQALYTESEFLSFKDPNTAVTVGKAALDLATELDLRDYRAAFARRTYAVALSAIGQRDAAVTELRKTLVEYEQLFGPDYIEIGAVNRRLADILLSLGRLEEAKQSLQRLLEILDKQADIRGVAAGRITMSRVLQASGDWKGARRELELAKQERGRSSEKGSPTMEQIRSVYAGLLIDQGAPAEAIEDLLELQRTVPASQHLGHLAFCSNLATAFVALGKLDTAQLQIERAKTILAERGGTNDSIYSLSAAAAQLEAAKGNATAAKRELEAAQKAINANAINPSADLRFALTQIRVYHQLGDTAAANGIAIQLRQQILSAPADAIDARVRGELALYIALASTDEPALARQLLAMSVTLLERTQVPTSPLLERVKAVQRAAAIAPNVEPPRQ